MHASELFSLFFLRVVAISVVVAPPPPNIPNNRNSSTLRRFELAKKINVFSNNESQTSWCEAQHAYYMQLRKERRGGEWKERSLE